MKFSSPTAACALWVAAATTPLLPAAQTPNLRILLKSGDTLPNGDSVLGFQDVQIADNGRWASFVGVAGGTLGTITLVVDGQVRAKVGDLLTSGEEIRSLRDLAMGRNGQLAVLLSTGDPVAPGPATDRIRVSGGTVLSAGDTLSGPGPFGSTVVSGVVRSLGAVDFDGDWLYFSGIIESSPGVEEAFLAMGALQGGALTVNVVSVAGIVIPGTVLPLESFDKPQVIDGPTPITLADVGLKGPSGTVHGLLSVGEIVVEDGEPSPISIGDWALGGSSQAHINANSDLLISGSVVDSGGNLRGGVFLNDSAVALAGTGLNGNPATLVDSFSSTSVRVAEDGTALFTIPLTDGSELLMAGFETVVQTGVSEVDGLTVTGLKSRIFGQYFDATRDGRTILHNMTLEGNVQALVAVEREIGTLGMCTPVPNSTGAVGTLSAAGSRFVANNDLRLRASDLPLDAFGYLLTSRNPDSVPGAGGSVGTLCLGGEIGRFVDQVQSSGSTGQITTTVNLVAVPQPTGPVTAMAGETWYFQLWHRDSDMGNLVSNFTQTRRIQLR